MRLAGLGAIAALGAMLAMPVFAQTTTTTPAVRPPVATMPAAPMPSAMPPATRPMPSATAPAAGTTMGTSTMAPAPGKSAAKPMAAPVDINTASAAELDKVKYIGPKRAAKIIAGRPWKSPDDIVAKKIMPKSTYDKIKASLTAS